MPQKPLFVFCLHTNSLKTKAKRHVVGVSMLSVLLYMMIKCFPSHTACLYLSPTRPTASSTRPCFVHALTYQTITSSSTRMILLTYPGRKIRTTAAKSVSGRVGSL